LVIELIDLDPVIGIDVSSLLENCCDAPVFPLLSSPFDLVETITTSFNAFLLLTTLTVKLLLRALISVISFDILHKLLYGIRPWSKPLDRITTYCL
jgi:hypothetical protein